ncbi:MAG: hypothetical protein AAGN66_11260 [Acidobacteriota bacterium]
MSNTWKLEIGHCRCFEVAEHTYARTKLNGEHQWYDCFGGHKGEDNTFPNFLWRKTSRYTRIKKTKLKEVDVDKAWADRIAGWGSKDLDDIQPAHAGLTYLITGVCHQACNRVLYAATEDPWGYINYPPSLDVSWVFYGYYGEGPMSSGDKASMKKLDQFKRQTTSIGESPELSAAASVQRYLDLELDRDELRELAAVHFGLEATDRRLQEMVDQLMKLLEKKSELDRALLTGEIRSISEAVEMVNGFSRQAFDIAVEQLSEAAPQVQLMATGNQEPAQAASESMMPELALYRELGKQVQY